MKPSAYLVNTARGGIVDQEALYEALKEKKIAGAALDVFENEPLEADSPLRTLDNIYLSAHVAGITRDSGRAMGLMAADNTIRVLRGESPLQIVNPAGPPSIELLRQSREVLHLASRATARKALGPEPAEWQGVCNSYIGLRLLRR